MARLNAPSHSPPRHRAWQAAWVVWGVMPVLAVWAQDLTVTAKVDKTDVEVGEPISLTLTLSGDVSGVSLPPIQLPEHVAVAGRSQATNFSFRSGAMERSVSVLYVLIPQRAGTLQLGPFHVTHQDRTLKTEPIEITVKKPALPPRLRQPAERFYL